MSLPLLVAVASVAAALSLASSGMWKDAATANSGAFTTGSVDIATTLSTTFLKPNLEAPGDSTGGVGLTVQNLGGRDFRYAMTVNADNDDGKALRDTLVLTVKTKTANPCTTFDGTTLYTGSLNPAGGLVIGDPVNGEQASDRTLRVGMSEVLCFRVDLPMMAPNEVAAASTTAEFSFSAEEL